MMDITMRLSPIVAAVTLLSLPVLASAASITWSAGPQFNGPNGDAGILTNGALVEAVNLSGNVGSPIVVDTAGLNITFTTVDSPLFLQSWSAATGGGNSDAGWAAILSTFEWQAGSNVSATSFLSGLTIGNQYQLQLFAARNDNCCSRTHSYGDGAGNVSASYADNSYTSVVGTFTADAATQTIEFFDSSNNPYLNAYVLRDLTAPIPEPGTWALMLAGLAAVSTLARRRAAALR
jgi:PEP-CTERM motif